MTQKFIQYECDNCGEQFTWSDEFKPDPSQMVMHYPLVKGFVMKMTPLAEIVPKGSETAHLCLQCHDLLWEIWANNPRGKLKKKNQNE